MVAPNNSTAMSLDRSSYLKSFALVLIAHASFGSSVVLVKYLLRYLPPFRLMFVGFCLTVPLVYLIAGREVKWSQFRHANLWLLSGVVTARSITKLIALRFTLATYVQLMDLTVPFLTAIIAWMMLREAMPPWTLRALVALTIGSFLVIVVSPFDVQLPNGSSDLIGIVFALSSSIAFAINVVYTRHLTTRGFSPITVYFQRATIIVATYAVLSLIAGERWESFTQLTVSSWVVCIFLMVAITSGGFTQVLSVSRVNATLFSTLLSWRLLVVLGASWVLLGEWLTSVWQGAGVVIVFLTITLYLRHQADYGRGSSIQSLNTTDLEGNP